jgi:hypothetical protein
MAVTLQAFDGVQLILVRAVEIDSRHSQLNRLARDWMHAHPDQFFCSGTGRRRNRTPAILV